QDTCSWKPAALLLTGHHAQAADVLNHPRALEQRDGRAGPSLDRGIKDQIAANSEARTRTHMRPMEFGLRTSPPVACRAALCSSSPTDGDAIGLLVATALPARDHAAGPFDRGGHRAAVSPRADDDAAWADADGDVVIASAAAPVVAVLADPNIGLRHLEVLGLGRNAADQQRGCHEYGPGCRQGESDLYHARTSCLGLHYGQRRPIWKGSTSLLFAKFDPSHAQRRSSSLPCGQPGRPPVPS